MQFSINDRGIDVVSHFNYLGIILDENISWKKHVAMITNKLSNISGVLHRLLNAYDMHNLKVFKFMYKDETPYNLRPAPLPVPQVTYVYAEDRLVYKLVEMKNKLAASYESILIKLDDLTFSQLGFSKFVTNIILESYSYNCYLNVYVPVDVFRLFIWVWLVSLVCIIKFILCLFL